MSATRLRAVLFDLDGTLVDTAPDLHAAANALLAEAGRAPIGFEAFRLQVSRGGRAMLAAAFPDADAAALDALLPSFLDRYGGAIAVHSGLFEGISAVLEAIANAGARWGVVTNKPERLARDLLEALDLSATCAVLIGGDTLATRKPDPEPLREACRRLGVSCAEAIYVGDDPRDVAAARAAPMTSMVARWGYVDPREDLASWGADRVLQHPRELLEGPLAALGPSGG